MTKKIVVIKYYEEQLTIPNLEINFSNIYNQNLYAKVTIDEPKYGIKFADDSTEKTYTLSANQNNNFSEGIKFVNLPTETDKTTINLKCEYFSDSSYTNKISETNDTMDLLIYIQNSEDILDWDSATNGYTNVADDAMKNLGNILPNNTNSSVTIDYFTNSFINGKYEFAFKYNNGYLDLYISSEHPLINDTVYKIYKSTGDNKGSEYLYINNKTTTIYDKIISFIMYSSGGATANIYLISDDLSTLISQKTSSNKRIITDTKISDENAKIAFFGSLGIYNWLVFYIDKLVIFNKL